MKSTFDCPTVVFHIHCPHGFGYSISEKRSDSGQHSHNRTDPRYYLSSGFLFVWKHLNYDLVYDAFFDWRTDFRVSCNKPSCILAQGRDFLPNVKWMASARVPPLVCDHRERIEISPHWVVPLVI